jgi:ATP-dependent exoDNAse (exonuclease V) alpha subunit
MYKVVCSTPVGNVEFQTPERPEDRGRLLKYLFKQKKYKEYFSIKNSWTDLRTLGAQTIHKSQGSTYREVFLDLDDISRNNKWHDIARLMYVGLTRATDKVYLYGNLRNLPSQQREPE